ncbi:MAG: signal peptidase II [Anaerohalosphaeraceae bacterium]
MTSECAQTKESSACGCRFSPPDKTAWVLWGCLTLFGAAADLWTKQAVFDWLGPVGSGNIYRVIPGFFHLVPCVNAGAAFSILQGQRVYLIAVSVLALLVIVFLFVFGKIQGRLLQTAVGLITAGIVGNLYDRIFNHGLVRDFLDFHVGSYHWPTFNLADTFLCVGVGLILLAGFTSEACQKQNPPQK